VYALAVAIACQTWRFSSLMVFSIRPVPALPTFLLPPKTIISKFL
jgi:hypothetical protein